MLTNKLTFMPSAFFYQNELAFARMNQQWILPLVNTNSRIVSPETLQRADDAVRAEMKHYSPYKVQALMTFPAVASAVKIFAELKSVLIWPGSPARWNVTVWLMANIPKRWMRSRRNSSKSSRTTSSTANHCIIAGRTTANFALLRRLE